MNVHDVDTLLDDVLAANNGYIGTAQAVALGFSRSSFHAYVKRKNLVKVEHGLYHSEDERRDEMYELQYIYQDTVFSHETSLMLHELSQKNVDKLTVTVKSGSNATQLYRRRCKVHYIKPELFTVGIVEMKTWVGNRVKCYNMERTICDVLRAGSTVSQQDKEYALREYYSRPGRNLHELVLMSQLFNVENQVRIYNEVMR